MKFIVLFEDNPAAGADVRRQNMPAHLAFLEKHKQQIETAGPLHDTTDAAAGGLWIVDTNDTTTVEHLVKTDPLWATGLRKSYEIRRWTQVFDNGKSLL